MAYEIEKGFETLRGDTAVVVGQRSNLPTALPIAELNGGALLPFAAKALTVSQAAALYLADPSSQRTAKSLMIYRTTYEPVFTIIGTDTPLHAISRETCRDLLSVLRHLPSNARKRFLKLTPREAAANAQANGIPAMSAANVNEYLNSFRHC
jgi:hypothetical protein